ncbi:MAG: 6-bladed beta-propeller [Planctomycetes bacterium]|nr:6-bladed beta-propeller [Planctomycetota bacterium]
MNPRNHAGLLLFLLAACAATEPAAAPEAVLFPPPPDPPRILFLRSVSSGEDVQPKETSWLAEVVVGADTEDQKPMPKPCAIGFRDGCFYVTDTQVGCIYRLDFASKKADQVELKGRAQLNSPTGMCFAPDGTLYVADRARKQVVVLDQKFQWVKELGPWEPKSAPTDVAVWQDRLYVVDTGAACVRVFDLQTEKELLVLGNKETEDEFMRGPVSLALDGNGYLYAVDTIYQRICVWDRDGNFVRHIGKAGDAPGHLARPKGLAIDDRKLWILDSAFDNCQILDLDGNALIYFGGLGETPGCMSQPRKVWVGAAGIDLFEEQFAVAPDFVPERIIVVTNTWGPKINFYALGKSKKFRYEDPPLPERPSKPAPPAPEQPAQAPGAGNPAK